MRDTIQRALASRTAPLAVLLVAGAASCGLVLAAAGATAPHRVSQKGRAFTPGTIAIQHGEAIEFVNDDGDLLHHAYLENDRFAFDTGDQEPGSKSLVTFSVTGNFVVMCGIHPKMKLAVAVK